MSDRSRPLSTSSSSHLPFPPSSPARPPPKKVELIAQRREARRSRALREKAALNEERKTHGVDLDGVRFARMVAAERERLARRRPSNLPPPDPLRAEPKVAVMVRKRPLIARERALKAVDVVSCLDNHVVLHEPKTRVDLTRRVRSSAFTFDAAFDERVDDRDVYREAVSPLVKLCLEASGADATCFAYGQTGSGKTHTMNGCYRGVADEVCAGAERGGLAAWCSFLGVRREVPRSPQGPRPVPGARGRPGARPRREPARGAREVRRRPRRARAKRRVGARDGAHRRQRDELAIALGAPGAAP